MDFIEELKKSKAWKVEEIKNSKGTGKENLKNERVEVINATTKKKHYVPLAVVLSGRAMAENNFIINDPKIEAKRPNKKALKIDEDAAKAVAEKDVELGTAQNTIADLKAQIAKLSAK